MLASALIVAIILLWAYASRDDEAPAPAPTKAPPSTNLIEIPAPAPTTPSPTPLTPAPEPEQLGVSMTLTRWDDARVIPAAQVLVGGAGIYPAQLFTSDADGALRLPPDPLPEESGDLPRQYELIARAFNPSQPLGRWVSVQQKPADLLATAAAQTLTLEPAAPLNIEVVSSDGQPVAQTYVQLSRDALSVVKLEGRTDLRGRLSFEAIPPGDYIVSLRPPGHVPTLLEVSHKLSAASDDELWSAVVEPAREIYGCVVDEVGQGVGGVLVEAFVDERGEPGDVRPEQLLRVDSPVVQGRALADPQGCFSLSGLNAGVVYLVARSARALPAISAPYDLRVERELGPVTFAFERGLDVIVTVVDDQRRPVQGALVRWRAEPSGLSGALVSDERGLVILQSVPQGITIDALLRQFRSPSYALGAPNVDGDYSVEVSLSHISSLKDYTIRLNAPPDVSAERMVISLTPQGQPEVTCQAQSEDGRDWQVLACPEGEGQVQIETLEHGRFSAPFKSGTDTEVRLPAPAKFSVEVSGLDGQLLGQCALSWRSLDIEDEPWRSAQWEDRIETRDPSVRWVHQLYPGEYELSLREPNGERWTKHIKLGSSPSKHTWSLVREHQIPIYVVNVHGVPVKGARVFWDVSKEPSKPLGISQGKNPLTLTSRGAPQGALMALSPTQGEGVLVVDADTSIPRDGLVITLNANTMTLARPKRVLDLDELERLLGVQLIQDRGALLIDVNDPQSAAAREGIPRGAYLLDARQEGPKVRFLIEHQGQIMELRL